MALASASNRCPVSVTFMRCVSRRNNAVPHSSSSVRNCRLKVGCEILKRRAAAEMLPHSTMQTKARSKFRSSKALMQNLHDCYTHSPATRKVITEPSCRYEKQKHEDHRNGRHWNDRL